MIAGWNPMSSCITQWPSTVVCECHQVIPHTESGLQRLRAVKPLYVRYRGREVWHEGDIYAWSDSMCKFSCTYILKVLYRIMVCIQFPSNLQNRHVSCTRLYSCSANLERVPFRASQGGLWLPRRTKQTTDAVMRIWYLDSTIFVV